MSASFDPRRGLIVVPAQLRGPAGETNIRLALDTGATATLIAWDPLALAGYDPTTAVTRVAVTTGSGVVLVPQVRVRSIEALGRTRRRFRVLCHTLPPSASVDGVLGLDFLRGTKLVLDFRVGMARLR